MDKNMKMILVILSMMLGLNIGVFGEEVEESQYIRDPLYRRGRVTYSAVTDRPVTGNLVLQGRYEKEHLKYEEGVIIQSREMDSYQRKLSENNYNNAGLHHGESFRLFGYSTLHRNGIILQSGEIRYKDGVILKDDTVTDEEWKEYVEREEDFYWEIEPGKRFTGRIHSEYKASYEFDFRDREQPDFKVSEYENGVLTSISFYHENGSKYRHYEYDSNGKWIVKVMSYWRGSLSSIGNYDENGKREGEHTAYREDSYTVTNYIKGIPHGKVTTYTLIDGEYEVNEDKVYDRGELINLAIVPRDRDEVLRSLDDFVIYPIEEIDQDSFEGYVLIEDTPRVTYISYIKDGKQVESYLYTKEGSRISGENLYGKIDGRFSTYSH